MIYNGPQIEIIHQQQQYIDTVIVPIIHVSLDEQVAKAQATASHFILEVAQFTEHQLKGRLLLLPAITYLAGEQATVDLIKWQAHLERAHFSHVLFITAESEWVEQHESVLWLPPIPLEAMDFSVKQKIIEEQFKVMVTTLSNLWSKKQLSNSER